MENKDQIFDTIYIEFEKELRNLQKLTHGCTRYKDGLKAAIKTLFINYSKVVA
jgi:hypothetical protein